MPVITLTQPQQPDVASQNVAMADLRLPFGPGQFELIDSLVQPGPYVSPSLETGRIADASGP